VGIQGEDEGTLKEREGEKKKNDERTGRRQEKRLFKKKGGQHARGDKSVT